MNMEYLYNKNFTQMKEYKEESNEQCQCVKKRFVPVYAIKNNIKLNIKIGMMIKKSI